MLDVNAATAHSISCRRRRVLLQNAKFYKRFPSDVPIIQGIVRRLIEYPGGGAPLPTGGILSPRGFQLLGLSGLGSGGGFERLHYLVERAFDGPDLSLAFLRVCLLCSWPPMSAYLHPTPFF